MSEKQCYTECGTTETSRFRSVKGEKWREAECQGLVRATWNEDIVLCNTCYMNLIENPLRRGSKRVKVTDAKEVSTKIELTNAIEAMSRHLYERECTIYDFEELRNLLQTKEPSLKIFFNQLYSAARPSTRNEQTMDRMK